MSSSSRRILSEEMRGKLLDGDILRATREQVPCGVLRTVLYLTNLGLTSRDLTHILFDLSDVPRRPSQTEYDWKELLLALSNNGVVICRAIGGRLSVIAQGISAVRCS